MSQYVAYKCTERTISKKHISYFCKEGSFFQTAFGRINTKSRLTGLKVVDSKLIIVAEDE
jgi:hypothetical protein